MELVQGYGTAETTSGLWVVQRKRQE